MESENGSVKERSDRSLGENLMVAGEEEVPRWCRWGLSSKEEGYECVCNWDLTLKLLVNNNCYNLEVILI